MCTCNLLLVEAPLELDIFDIVFLVIFNYSDILSSLPIFGNQASSVSTGPDILLLEAQFDFIESFASAVACNKQISSFEPDTDESSSHSEVIILEVVPSRLVREAQTNIHNDSVLVVGRIEHIDISLADEFPHVCNEFFPRGLDRHDGVGCNGSVTDAPEELYAFLSF